jgi:hypothetical protein
VRVSGAPAGVPCIGEGTEGACRNSLALLKPSVALPAPQLAIRLPSSRLLLFLAIVDHGGRVGHVRMVPSAEFCVSFSHARTCSNYASKSEITI